MRVLLPLAMIACSIPGAALADGGADAQGADATTTAPTEAGGLQEVTVTATRREESLSKVPISITALTSADMEERGIKDIADIARFTPGLSIDTSGTNAISIRGISASGGAGTTGIYIDDTPIQMRGLAFNPDEAVPKMFDIDRVEVLRGPQGTLFGAGSEGGTVRYITVQPSLTKTTEDARAEVDYTQGGAPSYEIGAAVGGPIIGDKFGARLTLWYRRDGGYIDADNTNLSANDTLQNPNVTEKNANYQSNYVARLTGLWAVTDNWTVTPGIFLQKRDQHNANDFWVCDSYRGAFSSSMCPGGGTSNSVNNYNSGDPTLRQLPDTFYLPSLKVDGDLGFAHFISNTSFYHRADLTGYEGTEYNLGFYQSFAGTDSVGNALTDSGYLPLNPGVPFPAIDGNGIHLPAGLNYLSPATVNNGQQNITQEFRLVSSDPNAALIWTAGLFYSYDRQSYLEQIHDPHLNDFTEAEFGLPYTDVFTFTDDSGNTGPVTYDPRYPTDSYFLNTHAVDKQYALYGEATYTIFDNFKATVGLRESHSFASVSSVTGGPQLYAPSASDYHSTTENAFTPKVNLAWQFTPQDLVYATYAKGFRPGGGDNPLPAAACDFPEGTQTPTTYHSDSLNSFEVGTKDTFSQVVKIGASIYYIKWNNIQQNVEVPVCELTYITNLGAAVAKGADLQVEWAVTQALSVELATGYTDAQLTKTVDSPQVPGEILASSGDAVVGESGVPNAPFSVSTGLEYHFNVSDHESFARLDWEYESHSKWLPPTQNPQDSGQYDPANFTLPSTSYLSLRAGMNFGGLSVQPFIDNLTDTHPLTNYAWSVILNHADGVTPYSRLLQGFTYRPRTFGVTFTYHH